MGKTGNDLYRLSWTTLSPDVRELVRLAPKFWSGVAVDHPAACWLWTRSCVGRDQEYGAFQVPYPDGKRRLRKASRVAWALANGRWPDEDELVRHMCDNTKCCNPGHLEIGSHKDNMQDRVDRKTSKARGDTHWTRKRPEDALRGAAIGNSKLTEFEVAQMKARYEQSGGRRGIQRELARDYGVSPQMVNMILKGKWWAHV